VLACTHYSLVVDRIAARAGDATVVDPAPAVARHALRVSGSRRGADAFLTTGDPAVFAAQLDRLGLAAGPVGSLAV
jgi:glutamate racemase